MSSNNTTTDQLTTEQVLELANQKLTAEQLLKLAAQKLKNEDTKFIIYGKDNLLWSAFDNSVLGLSDKVEWTKFDDGNALIITTADGD